MPSWRIKNLKKASSATDEAEITKQNVVQQIDAEYIDDDGIVLHQSSVCLGLSDFSSYTEYDDLTEQGCIDWVRNALSASGQLDEIENGLTKERHEKREKYRQTKTKNKRGNTSRNNDGSRHYERKKQTTSATIQNTKHT